jgi:DNA-binding NarL/FixJ family response regulator
MVNEDTDVPKIAIVDNDVVALRALTGFIPRIVGTGRVMWSALDGAKAISLCRDEATTPNILLLDISLTGMTGFDVCRRIREYNSTLPILLMTAFPLEQYAEESRDCGAQGIVLKASAEMFHSAVPILLGGGTWSEGVSVEFDSASAAHERYKNSMVKATNKSANLSLNESKVLAFRSRGYKQAQIADAMKVSESAVATYFQRARKKMGANTTAQAVVIWLRSQGRW